MARRSKRKRRRERARRGQLIGLLVALALALAWLGFGPQLRELLGLAGAPIPEREAGLRVVSWNLANFAGDPSEHDLELLRALVLELDPDVLALQEIVRPEPLAELLPEFDMVWSERGGAGRQRLAIAWRPERVELVEGPFEHPELALGGRVRPGFSAYLRGRASPRDPSGPDFWLLVVHLKAMPDGIDKRREQWPLLVELAERTSTGRSADEDLLIVGDFNSTGPASGSWADEQAELARVLGPAGLRRLTNADTCTAYWDGHRRDAWKEPSEIDLMWARGLIEALGSESQVRAGTHCSSHRCEPFKSTDAHPEASFERLSDHCPVVLDLTRADDD